MYALAEAGQDFPMIFFILRNTRELVVEFFSADYPPSCVAYLIPS